MQYKIDAEHYYQLSAIQDTIIFAKDSVIMKQRRRLFFRGVENWSWRAAALYFGWKKLKG